MECDGHPGCGQDPGSCPALISFIRRTWYGARRTATRYLRLLLAEIIEIQLLDDVGISGGHTHPEVNHQPRKLFAFNEHGLLRDTVRELLGVLGDTGGCDERTLAGAVSYETADEVTHGGAAYGVLPSLGLHINDIEPKTIFLDDAVDAAVSCLTNRLACVDPLAAIAHGDQNIDHQALEEGRGCLLGLRQ